MRSRPSLSASTRWGGTFDLATLRRPLGELNDRTSADGFWDEPDKAQLLRRERAGVEETIQKHEKLTANVKDLGELLDLAQSENDEAMIADVGAQIPELERGVRSMEVARMLSGPED